MGTLVCGGSICRGEGKEHLGEALSASGMSAEDASVCGEERMQGRGQGRGTWKKARHVGRGRSGVGLYGVLWEMAAPICFLRIVCAAWRKIPPLTPLVSLT